MATTPHTNQELSPWWKIWVIFTIFIGFSILVFIALKAYQDAPPIPLKVVNARGESVFTRDDILAGQQVFLNLGTKGKTNLKEWILNNSGGVSQDKGIRRKVTGVCLSFFGQGNFGHPIFGHSIARG